MAQGIGVQAFDLFDRLDTKNAKKGRIRKNSLLNSLFSGNLRIAADPSRAPRDSDVGNAYQPGPSFFCTRSSKRATLTTTRWCDPSPMGSLLSRAATRKDSVRPSTAISSAVA